jgi:hypothetical protein
MVGRSPGEIIASLIFGGAWASDLQTTSVNLNYFGQADRVLGL